MPLHPSLALVLTAVLGIVLSCLLMAVGLLWARLGTLSAEEMRGRVDDLAQRQDSIEVLLSRLERGQGATLESVRTSEQTAGVETFPDMRIDPAASSAVSGPTLITIPSLSTSVANPSNAASEELGKRFGAIWALADAGESTEAIARATGQPIGQVELILGLRRQLSQTTQPGSQA